MNIGDRVHMGYMCTEAIVVSLRPFTLISEDLERAWKVRKADVHPAEGCLGPFASGYSYPSSIGSSWVWGGGMAVSSGATMVSTPITTPVSFDVTKIVGAFKTSNTWSVKGKKDDWLKPLTLRRR